jgi:hypothetical protein
MKLRRSISTDLSGHSDSLWLKFYRNSIAAGEVANFREDC